MRNAQRFLFRTVAIAAFTGLAIGGTARLSSADAGYQYNENATGAGTGGSLDSGYTTETTPVYQHGVDQGTGQGTGGSLNNSSGTGGTYGSGAGGRTDCNCNNGGTSGAGTGGYTGTSSDRQGNSTNIRDRATRGSTEGGVTYPDNSDVLGPSGSDYWTK